MKEFGRIAVCGAISLYNELEHKVALGEVLTKLCPVPGSATYKCGVNEMKHFLLALLKKDPFFSYV